MKTIPLSSDINVIVDDCDYDVVSSIKWYLHRGANTNYAKSNVYTNGHQLMHRLITNCPKGMEVDHINFNGLDNRRENLRIVTHKENKRHNLGFSHNTSGVTGCVRRTGTNMWRVLIVVDGKQIAVGQYATIEKAGLARELAEQKYWHGMNVETPKSDVTDRLLYATRSNSSSGFTGVNFVKGRRKKHWYSYFCIDKKKHTVGYFLTAEEAYNARLMAISKFKEKQKEQGEQWNSL